MTQKLNPELIDLTGNITVGGITASSLVYPSSDGNSGQAIITDGSGNLTFGDVASSGMAYTASATAPGSPNAGDEWYDTDDGSFYKYINDGTSSQWVEWAPSSSLDGSEVISGNILPESDSAYNIGSSALQIATLYADSVTGLSTPTNNSDAATKGYVDSALSGISSSAITQGNSNVTVTDSGTGSVAVNIDGSSHTTFNSSGITLNTGKFVGTATTAEYADVAEKYTADADYEPGTVVVIGGDADVTQCTKYRDSRLAGVVSTNPAYLMNSDLQGEHVIELALLGRVPCKVAGRIRKGDLLTTSSIAGTATVLNSTDYIPGSVIGKALEDYNGTVPGVIEVLVGKV